MGPIAYYKAGQGLAVILVEGALGSRRASAELAKLLAPAFTVYSNDRRGRGESTDTKPYSVQREVEDIEALLDSAGEAACLYGISSGAALALEAAAGLERKVKKLAIYEVPYDSADTTMPDDFVQALMDEFSPVVEGYRKMGLFPPEVKVVSDASSQTKLLEMVGQE